MPFFVTSPMSMMIPMSEITDKEFPKMRSAMTAPMRDMGSASMIANGNQKLSNWAARTI